MAGNDIDIRLRVTKEGRGAEETARAVDGVGRGAKDAAPKVRTLRDSVRGLSAAMKMAGVIALIGQLNQLWELGKRVFGFLREAWDRLFPAERRAAEAAREAADAMSEERMRSYAGSVTAAAENWNAVTRGIQEAQSASDALLAAERRYADAVSETARAQADLEEARELETVSPGDAEGAARVKARYAARREALGAQSNRSRRLAELQDAARGYSLAVRRRDSAQSALEGAQGRLSDMEGERWLLDSRRGGMKGEDRERADRELQALDAEIAKLRQAVSQMAAAIPAMEAAVAPAATNLKAAKWRAERTLPKEEELAAIRGRGLLNEGERAALAARRQSLEEELRGQAAFLTGYSGSVRGAAAAAPAPRREDYGGNFGAWNTAQKQWERRSAPADGADRLARSAEAALDTLRKVDAAGLADALDRIRAESARIGREIERIKQRERNGK